MEYRIISLPPFRAASSRLDTAGDFSEDGLLFRFDRYFSAIRPCPRDSFMPRDFLYYDEARGGMVWIYALSEDIDAGENETLDFEGGYYLTYAYRDGDGEENDRLYKGALEFLAENGALELDIRPGHYVMGHIITPPDLIEAQGWAQMETFIPVKRKKL